ncbi:hypothetical protein F5883DRAFT_438465, partial [Diaporthe sp. PMI_573]
FIIVPNFITVKGMQVLVEGEYGDILVVYRELSAINIGVLLKASSNIALCERLGLNETSWCLIFILEGVIDSKIYRELVGKLPKDVFRV